MKLKFGMGGNFWMLITNFNSEFPFRHSLIPKSAFSYPFGKSGSHKMVAMVTRKRLSLIFFFQSVEYVSIEKVTKFQEKKFFRSRVILEKQKGGRNQAPPRGFSRIMLEQKNFFSWPLVTFSISLSSTLWSKKSEDKRFLFRMATVYKSDLFLYVDVIFW